MANLYTMRVYPAGFGREVYRVLEISGDHTLTDLAWRILRAFDFDFDHLFEFCMDNKRRSACRYLYYPEEVYAEYPSTDICLDELDLFPKKKFLFHYDFGDDWEFSITVQKVTEAGDSGVSQVIKEKGEIEQYPSYDEWDDD